MNAARRALARLLAGLPIALAPCAAQAAPAPRVIHPGLYAYRLALPAGWTSAPAQARRVGARLVLFAGGQDLAGASAVVYVNELCKVECGATLASALARTLQDAHARNPALQVEKLPPLHTAAGSAVPVRLLSGRSAQHGAREALAFIDTPRVVVLAVLTSRAPWSWDAEYRAFGEMVAGFRYYDCSQSAPPAQCQ